MIEKGIYLNGPSVGKLLLGLCEKQKYDTCWRLFERATNSGCKLPLSIYHNLIKAAGEAGNAEAVVNIMQEQLQAYGFASVKVYTTYIHALIKASGKGKPGVPMALDTWRRLDAAKAPRPAAKGKGLGGRRGAGGSSSRSGSSGSSREGGSSRSSGSVPAVGDLVYDGWLGLKATGQPLDAQAYLAGIHACVANGRFSEAEALFEPLRTAGGPSGPHIVAAYNLLLKAHSAAGATEPARRLFVLMKSKGVTPDRVTYNTLMTAFVAAGQTVMARAVLDKARREGVAPDVWSYTILLKGLAKEGDMAGAVALLDGMITAGVKPNQMTYGALLNGYIQQGNLVAAEQLVQRLEVTGPSPNRKMYNMLLKGLLAQGSSTSSSSSSSSSRSGSSTLQPTGGLAQDEDRPAGAAVGVPGWRVAAAVAAATQPTPGSRSSSSSSGITNGVESANAVAGDVAGPADGSFSGDAAAAPAATAIPVVDTTVAVSAGLLSHMAAQGVAPDVDTFTTIVCRMVQAGDTSAATALLQQMEALGLAPDTVMLTSLIMAAAQEGDQEAVLTLFDELLQMEGAAAWMGMGPAHPNTAAAAPGGGEAASPSGLDYSQSVPVGDWDVVGGGGPGVYSQTRYKEVEQLWGEGGSESSSRGYGSYPGSLEEAGTDTLPDVVAERLASNSTASTSGSSSSNSWKQLAEQQQQQQGRQRGGRRRKVLGGPDLVAWSALVAALVKCGKLIDAEAALEHTIQVAAAAQQVPPAGAFGALIRGYRQTGQQEKAVAVLRRLLQLGVTPADVVWEHVIDLCLQVGDYKAARQVVRAMELTGVAVDKAAYDARFQRHQQQQQLMQKWQLEGQGGAAAAAGVGGRAAAAGMGKGGSQGSSSTRGSPSGSGTGASGEWERNASSSRSSGTNSQVERLKWWLGLPNRYYDAEASVDET